jgi:TPR repeat protein
MCVVAAQSDHGNAVKYLTKGCDSSDANACQRLVVRYTQGGDVPVDLAKATEYANKTCALGAEMIVCKQAQKLIAR